MANLKPCYLCGSSLRSGVLFISIFYMLASMGLMIFCLREYSMHSQYGDARTREAHRKIDGDDEDVYKKFGVLGFVNIIYYLLLWHGAIKKSRNRCLIWFCISTIQTSFLLVRILFYDIMYYWFEVSMFVFNLYSLWVVWAFIEEIAEDQNSLPVTHPQQPSSQTGNVEKKTTQPIIPKVCPKDHNDDALLYVML